MVLLSFVFNNIANYGWILAIPFFLLGIAIPIVLLIWIASGGLPTGSWRRLWATLGISMTASTIIALILELLTMGLALAVVGVFAAVNPSLRNTLTNLAHQLNNARSMQDLLPIITPYLKNPIIFLGVLLLVSGFGPLIEEAIKPLAVWLVGKHLRSPAEGFILGALCGAGFALLEGLLVTSGATEMVGFSVAARATSSLMHITASGLMGFGIASALLQKRYGRLFGIYLLSTAIHSLWNASVLLTVYGGLRMAVQTTRMDIFGSIATGLGVIILGMMFIAILIALPAINHRLRAVVKTQNELVNTPLP